MALIPGSRLGPYEITGTLGAGGMGEVYRATDVNLTRQVAIKVLPNTFANDPERLARFEREAKTLAALNHPNIAQIYGFEKANGVSALVMELVEGPTLADRIAQGPIAVDETLPVAKQIAEALEAAHEQGIIHRDLKPANIKLRPDGTVKVLDFGLAKALEPAWSANVNATASPTITSPAMMTGVGVLLGTAAYMSPEQARGKPVDKRCDIWAFGCVLYEMLTGRRPFAGEDVTDTIAAVVRAEPEWDALPSQTPAAVRRVLKRCLEKQVRERLPHIGAARLDINEALGSTGDSTPSASPRPTHSTRLAWSIAAMLGLALAAIAAFSAVMYLRAPLPVANVYRSNLSPLSNATTDFASHLALSPDGRQLAFVARDAGDRPMLWVRPLDSNEAQPLAGTQGAAAPFWSPNNRSLAFIADGKLKTIAAAGGPVAVLSDAEVPLPGAWNQDDVIVFTPKRSSPVFRVSAKGGTPTPVTRIASTDGAVVHAFPAFLPDGRHFLYLSQSPNGSDQRLELASLDSPEPKRLVEGASNAVFANGYVLYLRDTTLMAQPFDTTDLRLTGSAMPLVASLDGLNPTLTEGTSFAASQTGVLVYRTGAPRNAQLTWFDRSGRTLGVVAEPGPYGNVWLSPDAQQAAVEVLASNASIRVWDLTRAVSMRMTSDPSDATFPVWSPDGTRLVFASRRQGIDLYEKSATRAGGPETVLWSDELDKFPTSWSPDGRSILYNAVSPGTDTDVWILRLTDDDLSRSDIGQLRAPHKAEPLIQTRFAERQAQFSPDGRWIAYVSTESGEPDVFVTRFPDNSATSRVSSAGGTSPQWRSDGRELFFLAPDGTVMTVAFQSNPLEIGRPRALFGLPIIRPSSFPFDVSPDGQRFLVNVPQSREASIALLVNWPASIEGTGR